MFKHGKTNKIYYSVREKIRYYTGILDGKIAATDQLKKKAKRRLPQLKRIDKQSYAEPKVIITDDKTFGNAISKPRLCIVVKEDAKHNLLVAPVYKTTSKQVVFDNDITRQISKTSEGKNKWIGKEAVYESKYIEPRLKLTKSDKLKIKRLYDE